MISSMKARILLAAVCLSVLVADNTLPPAEKKAGFRLLFDGHTLNGWRDPANETPPGQAWIIEDGCLKTTPKPPITEDLITQESYGDFELKFDWRISARANTGVKYRIQRAIFVDNTKVAKTPGVGAMVEGVGNHPRSDRAKFAPVATGQDYTVAYKFQLIDDAGYPELGRGDHVHDTGALYAMIPPRVKAARPAGAC